MMELHRLMGALHRTVNAGDTPADRARLVALVMSDRDFTEDDHGGCPTTPSSGGGLRDGALADAVQRVGGCGYAPSGASRTP